MKDKNRYPKGNAMTFPLELAQIKEVKEKPGMEYLYPIEVSEIRNMVGRVCDQMEYNGSFMYDLCPDKCTVQQMAACICQQYEENKEGCGGKSCFLRKETAMKSWLLPMTEIMLSSEMSVRRRSRHQRESYLSNSNNC